MYRSQLFVPLVDKSLQIINSGIPFLRSTCITYIMTCPKSCSSLCFPSCILLFNSVYFIFLYLFLPSYLASAVFQRASIASLASILVYLIFYLPYIAIFASESLLDALWKLIVPVSSYIHMSSMNTVSKPYVLVCFYDLYM